MRTVQITNPSDYNSKVYRFELDGTRFGFAVPAWGEIGLPELEVDCLTKSEAQAILREHRDYLEWLGYRVNI